MRLLVFFSTKDVFNDSTAELVWQQSGLAYNWANSNTRDANITVPVSAAMLANETIFAHIFLLKATASPRPSQHTSQAYIVYPMTKFLPRPKISGKKNLISGDLSDADKRAIELKEQQQQTATEDDKATTTETQPTNNETWIMFWKPALEIRVLGDAFAMPPE